MRPRVYLDFDDTSPPSELGWVGEDLAADTFRSYGPGTSPTQNRAKRGDRESVSLVAVVR